MRSAEEMFWGFVVWAGASCRAAHPVKGRVLYQTAPSVGGWLQLPHATSERCSASLRQAQHSALTTPATTSHYWALFALPRLLTHPPTCAARGLRTSTDASLIASGPSVSPRTETKPRPTASRPHARLNSAPQKTRELSTSVCFGPHSAVCRRPSTQPTVGVGPIPARVP